MAARKIFMKVNQHYKPEYQTVTSIIEENSRKTVLKQGTKQHLENMIWGYHEVSKYFPNVKFCDAKLRKDGIEFSYIQGKTLTELYYEAVERNDKIEFLKLIHKHLFFLETISENIDYFQPSQEFQKYFGVCEDYDWKKIKALKQCAFDCTSNNLILNENQVYYVDYEYCFSFPVPVSLYKFHCIQSLYCNNPEIERFIPFSEVAKELELDIELSILEKWKQYFISELEDSNSSEKLKWNYLKKTIDYQFTYEKIQKLFYLEKGISWYEENTPIWKAYIQRLEKQIQTQDEGLKWYQENVPIWKDYIDKLETQIQSQTKELEDYYENNKNQTKENEIQEKKLNWYIQQEQEQEKYITTLQNQIKELEINNTKQKIKNEESIQNLKQIVEDLRKQLFQIENSKLYKLGTKLHIIGWTKNNYDNSEK